MPNALWKVLREFGVPQYFVWLIKNLYDATSEKSYLVSPIHFNMADEKEIAKEIKIDWKEQETKNLV